MATSGRMIAGLSRPCQAAAHSAMSSSRPRLPAGLVSSASRARTAAAARSSGPGKLSTRRLMSSKGRPLAARGMRNSTLAIGLAGFSPPAAGSISGRSGRQSLSRAAFPLSCEFLMNDLGDRLRHLPDDTLTALSFFSRLPVARRGGSFDLRQGAGDWPIAGFLLAFGPALLLWLLVAADF